MMLPPMKTDSWLGGLGGGGIRWRFPGNAHFDNSQLSMIAIMVSWSLVIYKKKIDGRFSLIVLSMQIPEQWP